MQSAPKYVAFEARRFAAPDPRADGRRRFVRLDGDKVAIHRVVGGVFMRVTVPTSAYRGVALRVVDARDDGFAYEIRLVHADPDLSVALAETCDDSDIQAEWRLWARVLGLPALVERAEGGDESDQELLGRVAIRPPSRVGAARRFCPAGRAFSPAASSAGRSCACKSSGPKSCSAAPTPTANRDCTGARRIRFPRDRRPPSLAFAGQSLYLDAMRTDVFAAMFAFCFVTGVTPGPNNLMLMTSGVNFGFRRTLPHLMGVVIGYSAMVALVGFGLDAIFSRFPALLPTMRWLGAAYMLWLAWKIANSGPVADGDARGTPLGFFGAAAFQWINPKGWVMAVSALTAYAVVDDYARNVAIIALVYLFVAIPSSGVWAALGASMRRALADPRVARPFNWTMAALLAASIVTVFVE